MSGSGSGRRRRARHEEHEEHESHERWLVSYADLVTVLMALFIVMFAISNVDRDKMAAFAGGLAESFGNPLVAVSGGPQAVEDESAFPDPFELAAAALPEQDPQVQAAIAARDRAAADRRRRAVEAELDRLDDARRRIVAALRAQGLEHTVRFRYDERGLVVSIVTDDVLFATNGARLQPAGERVLDSIAPVLDSLPNDIAIDGHTDKRPTGGQPYASNWELSVARAVSVLRHLVEVDGLDPKRVTATGYADQRPLARGDSQRAYQANRRVEVVVVSTLPPGDRPLLPAVGPGASASRPREETPWP